MYSYIPDNLYKEIEHYLPIPCVDLLVKRHDKLLLLRRNNEPAQDEWFVPGGRIFKNEKLKDAAKRVLKEETGLTAKNLVQTGAMSHIWPTRHTLSVFYVTEVEPGEIMLNDEHSEYDWVNKLDGVHPLIVEMATRSRFFR